MYQDPLLLLQNLFRTASRSTFNGWEMVKLVRKRCGIIQLKQPFPYHPSMVYENLHENHKKSTIHVGKYTSPMDGMGL